MAPPSSSKFRPRQAQLRRGSGFRITCLYEYRGDRNRLRGPCGQLLLCRERQRRDLRRQGHGEDRNGFSGGHSTIYEPGLPELLQRNLRDGRLRFTTDLATAVQRSLVVFIVVGTPQIGGVPDLRGRRRRCERNREGDRPVQGDRDENRPCPSGRPKRWAISLVPVPTSRSA